MIRETLLRDRYRYLVTARRLILRVRRVTARELREAGVVDLPGLQDARAVAEAAEEEAQLRAGMLSEEAAEKRARKRAEAASQRIQEALAADPTLADRLEQEIASWTVAAVDRIGVADEGVAPGVYPDVPDPDGDAVLEPARFSHDRDDDDPERGVWHVSTLEPGERLLVKLVAAQLLAPRGALRGLGAPA